MKPIMLAMLACTALGWAVPALAHAHLKSAVPADGAKVKMPSRVTLQFSEALEPAFSGARLLDGAGHVQQAGAAVGGSTITLLPQPLKPGAYRVEWHSVGHDTHRMTGSFGFTVIP